VLDLFLLPVLLSLNYPILSFDFQQYNKLLYDRILHVSLAYLYLAEAVETLKNQGVEVKEEDLEHLSPLGWEHINLTGDFQWNMRQIPPVGHLRPLRTKKT
jgi:hypothetical protein